MALADQIIRALGINPDQARMAVQSIVNDCGAVKNGVLGAQAGFAQACSALAASQARMEARMEGIERALVQIAAAHDPASVEELRAAGLTGSAAALEAHPLGAAGGEAAPANPPLANGAMTP